MNAPVGYIEGSMFIPSTHSGSIAQYYISWALPNAIQNTWHELAKTSPTFAARYAAKAQLMYDIQEAVKGSC